MRLLPRSLSGRIVVLTLLALLVSQLVSFFIFTQERDRFVRRAVLGNMSANVAAAVRTLPHVPVDERAAAVRDLSTRSLRYRLQSAPGVTADNSQRAREYRRVLARRLQVDTARLRVAIAQAQDGGHHPGDVLVLALRLDGGSWLQARQRLFDPTRHWARSSLTTLAVSALLMLVIVILASRRMTRPLRALAHAAERFGRGGDVAPLDERGPEEIRRSIAAFNRMRERLARFVGERTRLIAAIAHDLRTPITALRLRLEFLPDDDNTRAMAATLDDMARMSEASLAFMREEAATETTRNVDLAALVDALCEDYRAAGQPVAFEPVARVTLMCRPVAIKRALRNIIDNALAYGERAQLELSEEEQGVTLNITDRGPGIEASEQARVFEPFVRLEASRSRETGGTGLGLAIARSVVQGHGGEIRLHNRPEGGLCVRIRLPRELRH